MKADVIAQQAAARGLDGVCLTEHNALWDAAALRELSERHEVTVLRGMELGTDVGHVLVFGLDRYSPELLFIDGLHTIVRAEGAAMVLAHPMRPLSSGRRPSWEETARWFEALEAINGDHGDSEDGYYTRLASELGVAGVAGSDAHSRPAVGRVSCGPRAPPWCWPTRCARSAAAGVRAGRRPLAGSRRWRRSTATTATARTATTRGSHRSSASPGWPAATRTAVPPWDGWGRSSRSRCRTWTRSWGCCATGWRRRPTCPPPPPPGYL